MTRAALFLLMALGTVSAQAAPRLLSCEPMEILYNGTAGMSYEFRCAAPGWTLRYVGAIPSGKSETSVPYRLRVEGRNGVTFTHDRLVRVASPSALGQALAREAVYLDNGDLALRECPEIDCTLYRPVGEPGTQTSATALQTPEYIELKGQFEELRQTFEINQGALASCQARLKEQGSQLKELLARPAQNKKTAPAASTSVAPVTPAPEPVVCPVTPRAEVRPVPAPVPSLPQSELERSLRDAQKLVLDLREEQRREVRDLDARRAAADQEAQKLKHQLDEQAQELERMRTQLLDEKAQRDAMATSYEHFIASLTKQYNEVLSQHPAPPRSE